MLLLSLRSTSYPTQLFLQTPHVRSQVGKTYPHQENEHYLKPAQPSNILLLGSPLPFLQRNETKQHHACLQ